MCEPVAPSECPLPDLRPTVLPDVFAGSSYTEEIVDDCTLEGGCQCAVQRRCVAAAGRRRLLQVQQPSIANIGAIDVILGGPLLSESSNACEALLPLPGLHYELLAADGSTVATGEGLLTCAFDDPSVQPRPLYSCDLLGIPPLEEIPTYVDCPPDITDVAPGDYDLRVTINPDRRILESDYRNNTLLVRVSLPDLSDPLTPCPDTNTVVFNNGVDRECGWSPAPDNVHTCVPGEAFDLGCPDCTGDPTLRVCDGESPCTSLSSLSLFLNVTQACPSCNFCPGYQQLICPPSGTISSWIAPSFPSNGLSSVSCNPRILTPGGAPDAGTPF